jgi:hypothetical protein
MPAFAGLFLFCGREAVGQVNPIQNRFSTHDYTLPTFGTGGEPIPGVNDFREFWADVKTPGDGSAYSVGTIEVRTTFNTFFSGAPADPSSGLTPFTVGGGAPARQVVMLQQAAVASTGLGFQKFYHGTNPGGVLRATHGRGIAVWPSTNAEDTRIVICGESQDETLPLSNAAAWPGAGGTGTAGFIAMFNGAGTLLWSHHFFGTAANQHCAITDVSVRVEYDINDPRIPLVDHVTFCGISTYGMPASNGTLTAVSPFSLPTTACTNSAMGSTDNGPGQWDGIIGRLSRAHSGAGSTTVQMLSSVGGTAQDGLFGIAEIDAELFAVVGSTGAQSAPPMGADFPFTFGNCASAATAPYCAGAALVFQHPVGSACRLVWSQRVGSLAAGTNTTLRDVLVHQQWNGTTDPGLIVAGATDDGLVFDPAASLLWAPTVQPQAALGGGVDGFVLAGRYINSAGFALWDTGTFRGGEGDEGLTGVQAWNEFYDHFAVTGTSAGGDIDVASYLKTQSGGPLALLTGGAVAPALGGAQIGGSGLDRPTAVAVPVTGPAMRNATTLGGFAEFGLGNPAGGGISIDPSGRTNVVGTTVSGNFPVPLGRPKTGFTHDAVRVALDMVPAGIGRTDGTTTTAPSGAPTYPGPFFGGTTPECALTPFGHQIGSVDPQGPLTVPRMLIDWLGAPPAAGVNGVVVASRPKNGSSGGSVAAALQFNFPGPPAPYLPDGILIWTTDSSAMLFGTSAPALDVVQFPIATLPTGPMTLAAQVIYLLAAPSAGGSTGPTCPTGGQSTLAASPGMWISW